MHWVIRTKPHHSIYQWRGSNCKVIHWELLEAQSTLVNPMGSMKEPWKPGNGTTFSSPLFGVSTYVQLLILFCFFSLSFAPSMIYLDGTRKSLMSSISNLPMVPTGKELLPSFYKWGNWASKKIHLNCLLDHSDPSCGNHILAAVFLMNMSFQNTVSNSVQAEESLTCRFWSYPARCLRSQPRAFPQGRWSGRFFQHSLLPPGETIAPRITQGWNRTSDGAHSPGGKGVRQVSGLPLQPILRK